MKSLNAIKFTNIFALVMGIGLGSIWMMLGRSWFEITFWVIGGLWMGYRVGGKLLGQRKLPLDATFGDFLDNQKTELDGNR
ncbi:hypothetical protein BH10PSE11_BH10PSE11_35850 [soil metagenome]